MDKPLLWAIHRVRELPTFVHGRVALLGDAVRLLIDFNCIGLSGPL